MGGEGGIDLVAALCSEVWQRWKRTSLRAFVKVYLPDMIVKAKVWVEGE